MMARGDKMHVVIKAIAHRTSETILEEEEI